MNLVYIFIGGGIGAVCRYGLSKWIYSVAGSGFPIGTLAVNLLGCLVIGFLAGLFERWIIPAEARLFIFVGILGGFTTFSSYGLESFNLLKDSEVKFALVNILVSNGLGLILVFSGYMVSHLLIKAFK